MGGFLEKTMTALNIADAARRQTIFESTSTHQALKQNTSKSNLQQPQIQYVQVKLADGRSIEVPEYYVATDENPPFSSTHLPNVSQGQKSFNFSNAPFLNNIPRNDKRGEPYYACAREGGTSAGNEFTLTITPLILYFTILKT